MTTFEQQWDAAAYNGPYWTSYVTMLVLPFIAAVLIVRISHCRRRFRLMLHLLAAFCCFLLTAELTVASIDLKWQLRRQAAVTEKDQQTVADRDGANLAVAPIIGGVSGVIAATIEGSAAVLARRYLRRPASAA